MPRKIQRYGWKPDLPDFRDKTYSAPAPPAGGLPPSVDMRAMCPPVYDQGQLGSCTANAIAAAFEFDQMKEKVPHVWRPSRLFIYFNERTMEGDVLQDAGAQIRDGIKSVNTQGCCSEDLWTYDDGPTKFAEKPPADCYTEGLMHLASQYAAVAQDINQIKGCIASGYPMVLGFTVYTAFESQAVATSGILTMPGPTEQVLGGHAVLAVGYDDSQVTTNPDGSTSTGSLIIRNSWGPDWGLAGYFKMPYDYITNPNLSSDFWTIRFVQFTPTA